MTDDELLIEELRLAVQDAERVMETIPPARPVEGAIWRAKSGRLGEPRRNDRSGASFDTERRGEPDIWEPWIRLCCQSAQGDGDGQAISPFRERETAAPDSGEVSFQDRHSPP